MNTLKPCPFCGEMPEVADDGVCRCNNKSCSMAPYWYLLKYWNTRPIEDELRKRIAELEAEIDIRKDQLREAKNILIDKNLQIGSLYEGGYKLQKRIAELEAESERFTVHSDIERQDDKSPNDTQTDTVVYGKEREE